MKLTGCRIVLLFFFEFSSQTVSAISNEHETEVSSQKRDKLGGSGSTTNSFLSPAIRRNNSHLSTAIADGDNNNDDDDKNTSGVITPPRHDKDGELFFNHLFPDVPRWCQINESGTDFLETCSSSSNNNNNNHNNNNSNNKNNNNAGFGIETEADNSSDPRPECPVDCVSYPDCSCEKACLAVSVCCGPVTYSCAIPMVDGIVFYILGGNCNPDLSNYLVHILIAPTILEIPDTADAFSSIMSLIPVGVPQSNTIYHNIYLKQLVTPLSPFTFGYVSFQLSINIDPQTTEHLWELMKNVPK
ncbi:serine/threonine-protein kinase phg2 [Aplysia californica]|uniref:Serine/threonine-protein kinase phg2 n=1 Tax=Aplysia californica TaxID=6500 RepID=A0ABM1A3L0_APLCA|nr:serine/threonine-protein kinase phg2 [Aplysia californica]